MDQSLIIVLCVALLFGVFIVFRIIANKNAPVEDDDDDEKVPDTLTKPEQESIINYFEQALKSERVMADNGILSMQPYYLAKLYWSEKHNKHYFELETYRSMALHSTQICEDILKYPGVPTFYASNDRTTDPSEIIDWEVFKTWQADSGKQHRWYENGKVSDFRCLGFTMALPYNTMWVKAVWSDGRTAYGHLFG